jgi:hypothetical protein
MRNRYHHGLNSLSRGRPPSLEWAFPSNCLTSCSTLLAARLEDAIWLSLTCYKLLVCRPWYKAFAKCSTFTVQAVQRYIETGIDKWYWQWNQMSSYTMSMLFRKKTHSFSRHERSLEKRHLLFSKWGGPKLMSYQFKTSTFCEWMTKVLDRLSKEKRRTTFSTFVKKNSLSLQ